MTCRLCGPLPDGAVHDFCHADDWDGGRLRGCGHPLAEHTSSLRCRTCGEECGLSAQLGLFTWRPFRPIEDVQTTLL